MARSAPLKRYINALHAAFDQSDSPAEVKEVVRKVFQTLQKDEGLPRTTRPTRLPVCSFLAEAEEFAHKASPALSELVSAFNDVEPEINWVVRAADGPNASDNWPANHANGMIFGPGGVEERSDVMIGASLLAPHVRYPDHDHPPEEIYLVLTPGRFQHGTSNWFTPGVGGTLHNVPSIKHAMASEDTPFLAMWCLLLKP
jgi:hypothetical protein